MKPLTRRAALSGLSLALLLATTAAAGAETVAHTTVLTNATVIDATGREPIEGATRVAPDEDLAPDIRAIEDRLARPHTAGCGPVLGGASAGSCAGSTASASI